MKQPTQKKKKINTGLKLTSLQAKNEKQRQFFKLANQFQVISLIGSAGTGKSILALYQALDYVEKEIFDTIYIIRSAVPSRSIGFLPGNKKEKMEEYEHAYDYLCNQLYSRGDAYNILKQKKIVQFDSTSFLRGITLDNAVVILDEAQNASYQELYTVLTRISDNTKVFICGDTAQDDLTSERYKEVSGLPQILQKLKLLSTHHACIKFTPDDIVRSGFVKDFIKVTQI